MSRYDFYTQGMDMNQFKHIPEISCYNNNYYIGNNKDLLFGKSDDDNTTEWWVIDGEYSHYLGESYTSENEILHRYDTRCT
jgi:hypothetical protein